MLNSKGRIFPDMTHFCVFISLTHRGSKGGGFGMFNVFKNLVGSKMLTKEDLVPVLDKMKEHLVGKLYRYNSSDLLLELGILNSACLTPDFYLVSFFYFVF